MGQTKYPSHNGETRLYQLLLYGYRMLRFLNLLLILSLLMAPLPHLLAAPGANQDAITTSVSDKHDHTAHHLVTLAPKHHYSNHQKQPDTPCKSGKSCQFCVCLAITVTNHSSQVKTHPGGYVQSLSNFQSTSLFPELRPPRQA